MLDHSKIEGIDFGQLERARLTQLVKEVQKQYEYARKKHKAESNRSQDCGGKSPASEERNPTEPRKGNQTPSDVPAFPSHVESTRPVSPLATSVLPSDKPGANLSGVASHDSSHSNSTGAGSLFESAVTCVKSFF